jgi:hypothetical protein
MEFQLAQTQRCESGTRPMALMFIFIWGPFKLRLDALVKLNVYVKDINPVS